MKEGLKFFFQKEELERDQEHQMQGKCCPGTERRGQEGGFSGVTESGGLEPWGLELRGVVTTGSCNPGGLEPIPPFLDAVSVRALTCSWWLNSMCVQESSDLTLRDTDSDPQASQLRGLRRPPALEPG